MALRIFFSYSHDDEGYRNQLEKHLALLKHQGYIATWHDRRIAAGEVIDDAIDDEINRADIILLLVSASFIASAYCFSREMTRAMERQEAGETRVVPVIVRDCDWHTAPFGRLNAVPRDGKSIASWANLDAAYADVARELRAVVEASAVANPMRTSRVASTETPTHQVASGLVRSGNLRVKQHFTDLDKARFLREGFDYIARYFGGSLSELSERNGDIEVTFQRVDAETFTAVVYRNGKQASACAIHLSGASPRDGGITYSSDPSRRDGNSYNERISAEADDQSLFLRSTGMSSMLMGGGRDEKLTPEGAAELFWTMLIRPLQ